jgi:hypothetical protein
MAVNQSDLTIVFQGPVVPGADGTARQIARTRQAFPHARLVLSTWDGSDCGEICVDQIVFSADPGGLPGIKRRDGRNELNNVNRQLRSTARGLEIVETGHAIKIRSDCALEHCGILGAFDRWSAGDTASRILACSLFTIDPQMFEQMAYHVSDWVQCGTTRALQRYWSSPFMTEEDATYYERVPYARHSTFMDRRFRCRLAVEQYVACRYAQRFGYAVPAFHNDVRPEIMRDHRRFLAEQLAIVDPWEIGLHFPKYAWAYRSAFQRLNCLLFEDWYQLYMEERGTRSAHAPAERRARSRRRRKRVARALSQCVDRAGPLLIRPGCKQMVNRLLSVLAQSRSHNEESWTVRQ